MIDLHTHILPGLDDGASSFTDAVELARAAAADGITALAGTPHVRDDYPTTVAEMKAALVATREALANAGIELAVHPGGEVALDRLDELDNDDLRGFALAGSRYLLLEFPYSGWPLDLGARLLRLRAAGLVGVLAHPERNAEVKADPGRLASIVASGALVQLTASSVDGRFGRVTQKTALALLSGGLAHLVASDAHGPAIRAAGLSASASAIGDEALFDWLTTLVPTAIVADAALPPRPAGAVYRRGFSLRGRLRARSIRSAKTSSTTISAPAGSAPPSPATSRNESR